MPDSLVSCGFVFGWGAVFFYFAWGVVCCLWWVFFGFFFFFFFFSRCFVVLGLFFGGFRLVGFGFLVRCGWCFLVLWGGAGCCSGPS